MKQKITIFLLFFAVTISFAQNTIHSKYRYYELEIPSQANLQGITVSEASQSLQEFLSNISGIWVYPPETRSIQTFQAKLNTDILSEAKFLSIAGKGGIQVKEIRPFIWDQEFALDLTGKDQVAIANEIEKMKGIEITRHQLDRSGLWFKADSRFISKASLYNRFQNQLQIQMTDLKSGENQLSTPQTLPIAR